MAYELWPHPLDGHAGSRGRRQVESGLSGAGARPQDTGLHVSAPKGRDQGGGAGQRENRVCATREEQLSVLEGKQESSHDMGGHMTWEVT